MRNGFLVVLVFLSVSAFGRSLAPNPVLGKVIGGVGENGQVQSSDSLRCYVYPNQVILQKYDAQTKRTDSKSKAIRLPSAYVNLLYKKVALAAAQKEGIGYHIVETIPHQYYFGFTSTEGGRVRLYFDGSRLIRREGKEAGELMRVIDQLCRSVR